jgi:outer membrane protein assembly factor BamA/autotransporter translocation and assembly factor TamB
VKAGSGVAGTILIALKARRKWAIGGAALIAVALVAVAILHSPPVRNRLLATVIARLEQAGYVVRVDGIGYNLLTLTADLSGVSIATTTAPSKPFFAANAIHASLPWRSFFGSFAFDRVDLTAPRITLIRDAEGHTNWPASSTKPADAKPMRISIGQARVTDLVFAWSDEQTASRAEATVSLDLASDTGALAGPVTMSKPASIQWQDRRTTIAALEGRLAWNERDLAIRSLSLGAPEGTLRADGRIEALLEDEPRIDLHLLSDAHLGELSKWIAAGRSIAGAAHADVRLTGPLAKPAIELTSLTSEVAGGSITASGKLTIDGPGELRAGWNQLDLPFLVNSVLGSAAGAERGDGVSAERVRGSGAPGLSYVPADRISGSLDARWNAPQLEHVHLTADTNAIDAAGNAAGSAKVELKETHYSASASAVAALGARVTGAVRGTLNASDLMRSPIGGTVDLEASDASRVMRELVQAKLVREAPPLRGSAAGAFTVGGTFRAPSLDGSLNGAVQYALLPSTTFATRASITASDIGLADIEAKLADSVVRGAVQLKVASGEIGGGLTGSARLKDLASMAQAPPTLPIDGTLNLSATLSGSLERPGIALRTTGNDLDIAGQRIDRLTAEARVAGPEIAIERVVVESGPGRIDGNGTLDLARETYAASLKAIDVPIRPVAGMANEDVPASGVLNGTFEGQGSFTRLGGRGHISLTDARWQDADLGRITSDLTLAGRDVSFTLDADDLALKGDGSVGIDPSGAVTLRGRWTPEDVAAVARRLAISIPLSNPGSAVVGFEVNGTRDRLAEAQGHLAVEKLDVAIADQPIQLVRPGRIDTDGRTIRVQDIVVGTGSSNLTIAGSLGQSATGPLTVTLDGSIADFWFVRDLIPQTAAGAPSLAGSVNARVTVEGPLAQPQIAGSFQVSGGRVPVNDRSAVTNIEVAAVYDTGLLSVNRATAIFEGATLAASARVPSSVYRDQIPESVRHLVVARDGPATLSAQLRSITQSIAAPFVSAETLAQLALQAAASLNLEADRLAIDGVRGTATLDRAEISLAGVPFDQQATTRLRVGDGRVTVDNWEWGRDENRVSLRGSAPLDPSGTIDLVANATLDLQLLNVLTPDARSVGRAYSEIRLGGTTQSPVANGYLTLSDGEARVADPRLIVGDLAGTITFAGDTLTLQQLSATVNGGDAIISGSIRHHLLTPVDGTITFRTTSSSLDLLGLRAEADAALDWRFDAAGPSLGGTVTLQRSAYREPLSLTGGLLKALQTSAQPAPQPATPTLLDRTRLDVRVVTGDDLIVDNNLARLTVRSDLRIVGTPTRPSVTGRAALGEGGALFFSGNRYRLSEGGSIDFANPTRIEPDLDLTAVTRVQGNEITLTLKGTPEALETSLSSDNPQHSQSDLVSLLVIGRTADASSANASEGAELVGLLTGGLLGAAGRAVGLDTVRVERGSPEVQFDAGLVASETNPGARLTFGKQIGSQWEVVFSQSLQQSGGTTWIVSYAPRSNIGLRVVSLDDGDRLYDFTHNLTFGGEKRAAVARSAPPPRIAEIRVTGAGADEPALRDRMKLRPGDRFSFFEWQDDRERIERFYHERERFEARVTAHRVAAPADAAHVTLTYDVRPGPQTSVVVEGVPLSGSTVEAIELAWTRAVVDEFLSEEVVHLAQVELANKGFLLPNVRARVERSAGAKQLRVGIDPGAHAGSRRVEFSGNTHESSDRLLAALKERGLERAVWTEPERVQAALEAFYHSNGYLDASVRIGPVAVATETATRPVQVNEGEVFRIGQIRIEGIQAFTPDEAVRLTGLTSGDTFAESKIEKAQVALDEQYRARGFNRVVIDQQVAKTSPGATVDVAVHVEEGPRQRLRDVVITGLERTRPSLVSRALKLEVGQPVDLAAWNAARRRLYQTGAFRSVDIQREVTEAAAGAAADASTPAEEPVRAEVTVQEWPPLRLRYGVEILDSLDAAGDAARSNSIGGSSAEGRTFGIGVAGDLGARNLFGRAISAGVSARYTLDTRAVRLYGTAPSFFGKAITSNAFVERSLSRQGATPGGEAVYEAHEIDMTFEQRIRPAARTEISYAYSLQRNRTFRIIQDPNDPLPFDVTVLTSVLSSSLLFDRRDDLTDATRGWFNSSNLEYAPPSLKSDVRFVRYFVQQRYYRRMRSVVFATSAQLGLATAFDQTLIPNKRFFAGGGNSVRGYDSDVLSPLDRFGNAVGGDALIVLNEELRFPIFKWLRGVTFFDAGRAFDEVGHLSLRDLSASTGFGLRVQTPFVLLRVDYGVPFDLTFGSRRGTLFFSIGQMF